MRARDKLLYAFLAVLLISVTALPIHARYYTNYEQPQPVLLRGMVEVQFESDVSEAQMSKSLNRISFGIQTLDNSLEKIGAYEAERIFPNATEKNGMAGTADMTKFYTLRIDDDMDVLQAVEELRINPYVRTADPVYALPVTVNPNDTYFNYQWAIKKINDTAAYNLEAGSDTAKVAIVDSGVLYSHPDLIHNIWVNPGEDLDNDMVVYDSDDSNMVDNDGNGYDDLIGYDFFNGFGSGLTCWTGEDCGTADNNPIDFNGHGTHCAGIAAAVTHNNSGVSGTAGGWGGGYGANRGARIICLRAGGSAVEPTYGYEAGYISSNYAAQAISYACDVGATSINLSFGMSSSLSAMTAALVKAIDSGVVVCHSAGNDNTEMSDYYDTYTSGGEKVVISVAATTSNDYKASFSNYGTWVEISAPGDNIYSTVSNHYTASYAYFDGTSMASPYVAGLAALIKSHMPDFDRDEIIPLMMDNADEINNETLFLQGKMGAGRINAYNCLDSLPNARFVSNSVLVGEAPLQVDFADESPFNPTSWSWDFGDGSVSYDQDPSHTYTDYGLKTVSMTVTDDFGTNTEVKKNMVMVTADTLHIGTITVKPDTVVDLNVYLDNKYQVKNIVFPIMIRNQYGNVPSGEAINLDSVIIDGCRTDYFERVARINSSYTSKKYTYVLYSDYYGNGSNYLQPDTGLVMKLRLSIGSHSVNTIYKIQDTVISGRELELESIISDYRPVLIDGTVNVALCDRGDANVDGLINIVDITYTIAWLYQGSYWPPDEICGDVNADGIINILDITYLINYLYMGGPPPPQ